MGKIACLCGHVFSTTSCPNDSMTIIRDRNSEDHERHVWRTYQLSDFERGGMLPEPGSLESDAFHESLYACQELEGELWECPRCGRLLLRRPGESGFCTFLPERAPA